MLPENLPYTPKEKAAITDILRRADEIEDSDQFVANLGSIEREFGRVNFQEIETICRTAQLKAFLVAVPIKFLSEQLMAVDPRDFTTMAPYFIAISWHPDLLHTIGLEFDYRKNYGNLAKAGWAIPRPNSEFSRMSRYSYN